ncbi:unnamed protein product [Rodentolepis nana]|uniref:IBB domain-containing protein n=1 Tax=Rodentolepis nana TaxID=102285 RepID=A0A0R3TI22_RODNA|nr:unnamed protein product [Rodentolepis nana]
MKESSRGESDREDNTEEDRLRRRALESLRRKKAVAIASSDDVSDRA